jgi:hypothetical protein
VLGQGDGDVVGGFGDERLDGIENIDLLAGRQVELGGRPGGGFLGDLDLGGIAQPPELDQPRTSCRASSSW